MSSLILPGDPRFDQTLLTFSPNFAQECDRLNGEIYNVVDPETGLIKHVDEQTAIEYLYGGEYDLRMEQIDDSDSEELEDDSEYWEDDGYDLKLLYA